ncbi:hypothetical protein [Mariniblastus fucicola]|uniref:Uncharacterized protein n=1 Tax=Mariniblastus fucicola TaxID=980251 RepID=A0A5B9PAE2_9BACT|nr:hypothetical protein [Mariniblastus fucicola]QEG22459.1 hypothetical protein MFFC18_23390 [Mariniblastus fucicola]
MKWTGKTTEVAIVLLGVSILCFAVWLAMVSGEFEFVDPGVTVESKQLFEVAMRKRPVTLVVVAMMAASVIYLCACWCASRLKSQSRRTQRSQRTMLFWIVGLGVLSRVVLLGSTPILEIDLYRYLWDGNVTMATGDPYKFAPVEFVQWKYPAGQRINFARTESETEWLRNFAQRQDESMQDVLRITAQHYGQYTSPYPPVSQSAFALSHRLAPFAFSQTSLKSRVFVLKTVLVLFDIATGFVLILILRSLKLPETMSIVWFWSPLVLKEFANGGHLDSVAIFCCTLFVLFAIKQLRSSRPMRFAIAAGIMLALGVGAKVFPVVLVPLWAVMTLKQFGWRAMFPGAISLLMVVAVNAPMLIRIAEFQNAEVGSLPKPGVLAFAESWEMNDMLFMLVFENLQPPSLEDGRETVTPWFVFTSSKWRATMTNELAFAAARAITTLIFGLIVAWLCWRMILAQPNERARIFAESVFLCLAWFWFLSPTQNPWYWCWALPFVPLARSRVWYLVGAMTLLYYLHFHFIYSGSDIAGFHYVVPFVEFGSVIFLLAFDTVLNRFLPRKKAIPAR